MAKKLKRNSGPCSCGSGRKFKKCCGRRQGARASADEMAKRLDEAMFSLALEDARER